MSAKMDEMKKSSLRLTRDKQQPIKTEWSSRYVLFTYFQGDINSMVDEHFSRALSKTKKPKEQSTEDQSEAASSESGECVHLSGGLGDQGAPVPYYDQQFSSELTRLHGWPLCPLYYTAFHQGFPLASNPLLDLGFPVGQDNQLPPNQWSFNSHWTKPTQELSPVNNSLVNCGLNMSVAQDSSPLMVASPPPQLGELWHLSSPVASPSPAEPGYPPPSFPTFHLLPGNEPERKYGSLLNLLQQDRCLVYPMSPAGNQARHSPHGIGAMSLLPTRISNPDGDIETNTVSPPKSESPRHFDEV